MNAQATTRIGVTFLAFLLLPLLFGSNNAMAVEAGDTPTNETSLQAAQEVAQSAVNDSAMRPTGVVSGDLWAPTLRMIIGLGGVLVVLGALAFAAKRLRRGSVFKSGMIEIISGMSLGGREKVVLLRVGGDEVLVGMSPSGMRPLHVIRHAEAPRAEPAEFETYMGTIEGALEL